MSLNPFKVLLSLNLEATENALLQLCKILFSIPLFQFSSPFNLESSSLRLLLLIALVFVLK